MAKVLENGFLVCLYLGGHLNGPSRRLPAIPNDWDSISINWFLVSCTKHPVQNVRSRTCARRWAHLPGRPAHLPRPVGPPKAVGEGKEGQGEAPVSGTGWLDKHSGEMLANSVPQPRPARSAPPTAHMPGSLTGRWLPHPGAWTRSRAWRRQGPAACCIPGLLSWMRSGLREGGRGPGHPQNKHLQSAMACPAISGPAELINISGPSPSPPQSSRFLARWSLRRRAGPSQLH